MSAGKSVIEKYENHSSIINIKNKDDKYENRYNISLATAEQINKIIIKLNPNKLIGPYKLPPKIAISSTNITDCHLENILCDELTKYSFSEGLRKIH